MDAESQEGGRVTRAANSRLVQDFGLLIKAATRLERRIDAVLRRDCGIDHTAFEVLIRLCRQPGEKTTQRELAEDLTLTSSGITRLVDRMEQMALVRRVPSPRDRRSVLVEATDHGRAVFVEAADAHARVVERFFVAALAGDDYTRLIHSLGAIEAGLRDDAD
ncbi:MarR family transcriptional regulator [Streptomyces sp. SS7]|uniref:MarR family winged helix-turn-helix transcriptional regulator n=1 Tax=Streptomyces sp. SS7 TaxID=3108485 RepID=UPI0030ED4B42